MFLAPANSGQFCRGIFAGGNNSEMRGSARNRREESHYSLNDQTPAQVCHASGQPANVGQTRAQLTKRIRVGPSIISVGCGLPLSQVGAWPGGAQPRFSPPTLFTETPAILH